jgi:hypothetical protein
MGSWPAAVKVPDHLPTKRFFLNTCSCQVLHLLSLRFSGSCHASMCSKFNTSFHRRFHDDKCNCCHESRMRNCFSQRIHCPFQPHSWPLLWVCKVCACSQGAFPNFSHNLTMPPLQSRWHS